MILYSPSTNGFYLPGQSFFIPENVVEITEARHAQLMTAQAEGRAIAPNAEGRPVLVPLAPPSAAAVRARLQADIRREAGVRIRAISPEWRQLNDLREPSEQGTLRFTRIDAIRAASDAIEDLANALPVEDLAAFPIGNHPLWPEFD